jgi:hypothetical protein
VILKEFEEEFLKKSIFIKAIVYLAVIASYSVVLMGEEVMASLGDEDGLIENLGAFFLLVTSGFFLTSYFKSSVSDKDTNLLRRKKNIVYLLLAVLFFIGFGEEISWGQRMFGWKTPDYFIEINRQDETNFHNIEAFNTTLFYSGGGRKVDKPVLAVILDVQTWFFVFWFSYCLLFPLMSHYSLRFNKFFYEKTIPLPPLWIGFLMLANFTVFALPYIVCFLKDIRVPAMYFSFTEIRESNEAFIFAVLAFLELKKEMSRNREG